MSPLIHRISPVNRLFSGSLGMDSRKLAVVFETLNADKSFQAAYCQLANSGESGQVLDEGEYMMHLRSRELQAFHNCLYCSDGRVVQQHRHGKVRVCSALYKLERLAQMRGP